MTYVNVILLLKITKKGRYKLFYYNTHILFEKHPYLCSKDKCRGKQDTNELGFDDYNTLYLN